MEKERLRDPAPPRSAAGRRSEAPFPGWRGFHRGGALCLQVRSLSFSGVHRTGCPWADAAPSVTRDALCNVGASMLCLSPSLSPCLRSQTFWARGEKGRVAWVMKGADWRLLSCGGCSFCTLLPSALTPGGHRERSLSWLCCHCGGWRRKPTNPTSLQLQVGACSGEGGQRKCSSGASLPLPWNMQPPSRKPGLLTTSVSGHLSPNALTLPARPPNLQSSLATQISAKY